MKHLLSLTLVLAAILLAVSPARADDPLPPFVTTTEIGWTTLDTSQMIETGTVTMPPPEGYPYFQMTVPGTDITVCTGCMQYNTYTDPTGQYTIVVPNAYTATVMAATGTGPFSQEPVYTQTSDGLTAALVLTGGYENMGISNEKAVGGWANTVWNALTLSAGEGTQTSLASDPFMLIRLAWANATTDGPNVFVPGAGYFVYENNGGVTACKTNCTMLPPFPPISNNRPRPVTTVGPTQRTTPIPQPTVVNLTVDCPRDPRVEQADPASTVSATKIAPNFPVVVGQDPEKTGVTFSVSMSVPPVYYSYNVKNYHTRCEGSGCGKPPGSGPVTIINWETCDRVTETYTDNLASISVTADLAQSSIDWITGELAQKYPGAHVYQAHWAVFPGACPGSGIGTPNFSATCTKMQISDPGKWIVNVSGVTTGTPVSSPRGFSWSRETFQVDLIETALTK